MKRATKNEFMKVAARKTKDVEIPEWEMTITLKSLSAKVVLECQEFLKASDSASFAYALIANSLIDEDGQPMFEMGEVADFDYPVVDRLTLEVMEFNGLAPEQVEKARQQLKNPNGSSITDSASN